MYYQIKDVIFESIEIEKPSCTSCLFGNIKCEDFDLIIDDMQKDLCYLEGKKLIKLDKPEQFLHAKIIGVKKLNLLDYIKGAYYEEKLLEIITNKDNK